VVVEAVFERKLIACRRIRVMVTGKGFDEVAL
jgi:hypothetical protein